MRFHGLTNRTASVMIVVRKGDKKEEYVCAPAREGAKKGGTDRQTPFVWKHAGGF